ncbi:TPA: hypothetical protein HA246_07080 [Candidatus Woesearchaeota archaeon]|nr:hypothetical protein [Candidatus Woesearchaeota archaeon]
MSTSPHKSHGTSLCAAVTLALASACISGQPKLEREVQSDEITAALLDEAPVGAVLLFPNGLIYEKDSDNYFHSNDAWIVNGVNYGLLLDFKSEELAQDARSGGARYLQFDRQLDRFQFQPGSRKAFENNFNHAIRNPLQTPVERFDRNMLYRVQNRGSGQ